MMSLGRDFQSLLRLTSIEKSLESANGISLTVQDDKKTVELTGEEGVVPFQFDRIYGCDADNATVYQDTIREVVESTLSGYNGTVIALGSHEGHSSTLLNHSSRKDLVGAVLRAAEQIFHCVKKGKAKTGAKLVVLCSYIAVMEDDCFDVLASISEGSGHLSTLHMEDGQLHGLTQCQIKSVSQVRKYLKKGSHLMSSIQCQKQIHSFFMYTVEHAKMGTSFSPVSGTLMMADIQVKLSPSDKEKVSYGSVQELFTKMEILSQGIVDNTAVKPKSPVAEILNSSIGGNCKTVLLPHLPENVSNVTSTAAFLSVVSKARHIKNSPDKRDLAERALMSAYLRELGVTKLVLQKDTLGEGSSTRPTLKKGCLESTSGTKLQDVIESKMQIDGRELLASMLDYDDSTNKETTTEMLASVLAEAALEDDDQQISSDSEEEQAKQSSYKIQSEGLKVSHCASIENLDDEPGSTESKGLTEDTEIEERQPQLKSPKKREWSHNKETSSVTSKEAPTLEILLALLQDPDRGASRAFEQKDVVIRKDSGGLFSGASIVKWMCVVLGGVNSLEDAISIGQLLLDQGAIFHSEGSRIFANSENLYYYARVGRTDPKMLSLSEIQNLLSQSGDLTNASTVSPSPLPSSTDHSISWNKTEVNDLLQEEITPVPQKPDTAWNQTEVHPVKQGSNTPQPNHKEDGPHHAIDENGVQSVREGKHDRMTGQTGAKPKLKSKRKSSARSSARSKGRRSSGHSIGSDDLRSNSSYQPNSQEDEEEIKFYNENVEMLPPPLTSTTLDLSEIESAAHGSCTGQPHNEWEGSLSVGDQQQEQYGSNQVLSAQHSMLLGSQHGDWYASQLFWGGSRLALSDQQPQDLTQPCQQEGGAEMVAKERKPKGKYSAKPITNTLQVVSEDQGLLNHVDYPTPLHMQAVQGDEMGVLRELVMMYGVNTTDTLGRSPLMFAILGKKSSACSVLIECGADVDQPAINGITALHLASYLGYKDIVNILLKKGATVSQKDVEGHNAIHWSTVPDSTGCLQLLIKHSYDYTINETDDEALSPLHWAISGDKFNHVSLLLKNGAYIDGMDGRGRTLLNYAICVSAINSFEVMLRFQPDMIEFVDSTQTTPLHLACAHPSNKFLDMIFKFGKSKNIDFNCVDNMNRTALHYATICNRLEAVKKLLQCGVLKSFQDAKGMTPLAYATEQHGDQSEVALYLKGFDQSDVTEQLKLPANSSKICTFL